MTLEIGSLYKTLQGQQVGEHRLSVLVFSYNRHAFLRRQMLYWADKPVDLLIADGSECAMEGLGAERQGRFRLIYHHAPGPRNVNLRMKWLASNAATPYVVFLDDQDTFLWSSAIRLMTFLDNSIQHASASGAIFCRYKEYQYWDYNLSAFDIDQEGVGARAVDLWGRVNPLARCAYSIMRASVACNLYEFRPAVDFDNEVPSDFLYFISAIVAGKHYASTAPALWRWDGSQPREYWRSRSSGGKLSADKIRLNEAIQQMCVSYGVAPVDREAISAIIEEVWSAQEAVTLRAPVEPTWLELRFAEIRAFARIRSRIKLWMRKGRDAEPLEFFTRRGGLEQDQIDDLRNVQAILAKYPDGVSAT